MKITKLEAKLIESIAFDEMAESNGGMPESASDVNVYLWLDERASFMGVSVPSAKGVLTSLKKKGLVGSSQEGDDSGVWFTEKGFEIFKEGIESGVINDGSW